MILLDTSVWHHALSGTKPKVGVKVQALLGSLQATRHELVALELVLRLGGTPRDAILSLYAQLPATPTLSNDAIVSLVREHKLFGRGLGAVEIHLLGAAKAAGHQLWAEDPALKSAAAELGIGYDSQD